MDSMSIRENRAENINKSIHGTGKSKQAFETKAFAVKTNGLAERARA